MGQKYRRSTKRTRFRFFYRLKFHALRRRRAQWQRVGACLSRAITQLICLFVLSFIFALVTFVVCIHENNAICHALIHAKATDRHIHLQQPYVCYLFIPFCYKFQRRFKFIYCFLIFELEYRTNTRTQRTYTYTVCMYVYVLSFIVIDNAARRIGTDDG